MSEFIHQIGIDWKLLLGQAVNFILLLIILRVTLYKPVLRVLEERKKKIQEGIEKAETADTRLAEINELGKQKMKEAEEEALTLLRETQSRAKTMEKDLITKAHEKETALLRKAEEMAARKKEELEKKMEEETKKFVKEAVSVTCELDPKRIDDALIKKAVSAARQRS